AVPVVPGVPKNKDHGNKNPEKRPVQSSCFDVPAYSINTRNNNFKIEDTLVNTGESSCSHIPVESSCSREFEDFTPEPGVEYIGHPLGASWKWEIELAEDVMETLE
ncbi:MAG: hypothetical protein Q8P48_08410, partial [Deltaproteobacteria bacterium]|nr:hypothetical protein [Deltaproteobacteria bacterium]